MKKYKLYETVKTKTEGVKVYKSRRGYKDVRVCLHNKATGAEWEVKILDNSKDANEYAKHLSENY